MGDVVFVTEYRESDSSLYAVRYVGGMFAAGSGMTYLINKKRDPRLRAALFVSDSSGTNVSQ